MTNSEKYLLLKKILLEKVQTHLSKKFGCQILSLPRSCFYWYEKRPQLSLQDLEDFEYRYKIEKVILEHPCYGFRRVKAELKRDGEIVNRKKIQRLMRKFGFSRTSKPKFHFPGKLDKIYPNLMKNLVILRPNYVWQADLTLIVTLSGILYLLAIIDCFTRKIVGWSLSKNYTAESGLKTLKMAIERQKKFSHLSGLIHHSDQGVPFRAKDYTDFSKEQNILISMARKGTPTDNPFIESFFKTLKYDEVYLKEYQDYDDACSNIKDFIERDYNEKRLHSALGYLPPVEFEEKYFKESEKQVLSENQSKNLVLICP